MNRELRIILIVVILALLSGCGSMTESTAEKQSAAESQIETSEPVLKTEEQSTEAPRYEDPVGVPFTPTDIAAGDAYEIIPLDYEGDPVVSYADTIYLLTTDMPEEECSNIQDRMKKQLVEDNPALNNCLIAAENAVRVFSLIDPLSDVLCFYVPVTNQNGTTFDFSFYKSSDPQNKQYSFTTYPIRELKAVAGLTSLENPAIIVSTDKSVYFIIGSKAYCFGSPYDDVPALPELNYPANECKIVKLVLQ